MFKIQYILFVSEDNQSIWFFIFIFCPIEIFFFLNCSTEFHENLIKVCACRYIVCIFAWNIKLTEFDALRNNLKGCNDFGFYINPFAFQSCFLSVCLTFFKSPHKLLYMFVSNKDTMYGCLFKQGIPIQENLAFLPC